jgi:hypothetical protein
MNYLLHRTLSLEQNSAAQQFAKYTTDRPNIHSCRIMTSTHQNFWSTIILRNDFLSHAHILGRFNSGQSKITDLYQIKYRVEISLLWYANKIFRFTFNTQLLFTNKLPGLMSRCNILAECKYLSPLSI